MLYTRAWEGLAEAAKQVMEAGAASQAEAQTDLCQTIKDKTVRVRAKLRLHADGIRTMADTILEGGEFSIPTDLRPEDIDWDNSRPLKPWLVPRGGRARPGYWHLEWIEASVADVEKAFGRLPAEDQAPATKASRNATPRQRVRPASERADRAVKAVYDGKIPTQVEEPNTTLCDRIGAWLKSNGLPDVSNDTILRAAGRRR